MTLASITLHGVRPDGTDQRVDGLTILHRDGDRMLLRAPSVQRGVRWSMDRVRRGTTATIHADGQDVAAAVVNGYNERLSLRLTPDPDGT